MALLGRMTKAAGRAAKNEVKRTVRRNASLAARSMRKRLDQSGTSRKTTRIANRRRKPVKKLPKMKRQGGWQKPARKGSVTMAKPLTHEQALEHYTELQRRVSVGAYVELEHDGSFPPDDGTPESTTLESIANLERWAERQGLAFCWNHASKTWSLPSRKIARL